MDKCGDSADTCLCTWVNIADNRIRLTSFNAKWLEELNATVTGVAAQFCQLDRRPCQLGVIVLSSSNFSPSLYTKHND